MKSGKGWFFGAVSIGAVFFGAVLGVQFLMGASSFNAADTGSDRFLSFGAAQAQESSPVAWAPTEPYPRRTVYYPGTEALAADEMRVVACGTGMPQPRLKQAAACFLVELGNGDKFIFDMGEGSFERISALGIPLDQLDKVFLGHLHLDHAGDFPAFYMLGPVNNRLTPVRVWGPEGVKPEWGTKAWADHMVKMWAWESATRGAAVDPRGLQLEVNEFDWKAENNVIFDENGVQVRTLPAIHGEQSVSFILEWNGLKFAYSSDTLPTKWWREQAVGADLAIHECFVPPDFMIEKYGFAPSEAVFVGSQGHTSAQAFGKIMSATKPRMAVCYHFQNDHDTSLAVFSAIRETYSGPLDLAADFMTWNVTKEAIHTREGVPNHESFPAPVQLAKQPPDSAAEFPFTKFDLESMDVESAAATNDMIDAFNERTGNSEVGAYTSIPFQK
ncbi:MAG: guanitoxin biosynthesis MBL fold metallo-hydrolase GntH [Roseibium sp.]